VHESQERDSLTGLINRRAFNWALEREVERARRHGTPLTIAICDVDDFKSVNDQYGHFAGDEVLKDIAARMQASAPEATLSRLGGDEFALLFPGLTLDAAEEHLEPARRLTVTGLRTEISISIACGYAEFVHGDSAMELLARADQDQRDDPDGTAGVREPRRPRPSQDGAQDPPRED
jgi:diguanylate cyclase (GGDEF)-like protein